MSSLPLLYAAEAKRIYIFLLLEERIAISDAWNLFYYAKVSSMNLEGKQIEPWRGGLTPFLFFSSHRKLPRTSFDLSEIFQFYHSWTSNLQYFLFLSNFFLLDNTLKGGDQVRGGFSSQNIPTPLKTIQKALLLFCLSLTTVVTKSVKKQTGLFYG